ncbi:hypothetical protein [Onishia niordana]|nr:hypothetical protein [Halomonas niordiana]
MPKPILLLLLLLLLLASLADNTPASLASHQALAHIDLSLKLGMLA